MTATSPRTPAPVLVLVPGATGAPSGGGPGYRLADPTVPQLSVTDLVATRGDGVFETIGAFDGTPVNVGPHLARLARSAEMIDLPAPDQALLAEGGQLDDPAGFVKRLNDMLTKESNAIIPLVYRGTASAHSNTLGGVNLNAWDSELWNVADWTRVQ